MLKSLLDMRWLQRSLYWDCDIFVAEDEDMDLSKDSMMFFERVFGFITQNGVGYNFFIFLSVGIKK